MFLKKFLENLRRKGETRGCTCDECGVELFDYPAVRVCQECESRLPYVGDKSCAKCGRATITQGVCLPCKQCAPKFDRAFAPFSYRADAASLVNRLKNGEPWLSAYFGQRMAERFLALLPKEEKSAFALDGRETFLIVPVPLTKQKKHSRGYNQAERLAEWVEENLRVFGYRAESDFEILQKNRENVQQKDVGFFHRAKNAEGAYHVHKRVPCRGRTILLVDDILTTGATASECASLLKGAGAKRVYALTAVVLPEQKPDAE